MSDTKIIYDVFKAWLVEDAQFDGEYEFPIIGDSGKIPERVIPFDKAVGNKDYDQWVHFYIHDREFERIWNHPNKYLEILKRYEGVITPDFSLYRDMPLSMQIWNTYRNRAVGYWLKKNGVPIIPNFSWGDERTYEFCFDGIEKHSIVAVGTHGTAKRKLDRYYLEQALDKLLERIEPRHIVIYGAVYNKLADMISGAKVPYSQFGCNTFEYKKKVTA